MNRYPKLDAAGMSTNQDRASMSTMFAALFVGIAAGAVTTTPSYRMSSLDGLCRGSTGQFAYEPDCHKFVNCGAGGLAYLQECPADLLFDPFVGICNCPQVLGKCRGRG